MGLRLGWLADKSEGLEPGWPRAVRGLEARLARHGPTTGRQGPSRSGMEKTSLCYCAFKTFRCQKRKIIVRQQTFCRRCQTLASFSSQNCGVCCPGTFWTITKKFKLFPGGASSPQTPPSSWLLSQPPQARFERLSQVGRCRGLQGWEVLGQWFGM